MRDTWIDEHTGDETVARPDFKAELRAELAKELAAPARRHAPSTRTAWRAIGWASVAAAAAVAGVVVLNNDDGRQTVSPATSTPGVSTPDTSTPGTTVVPGRNTLDVPASGGPLLAPTVLAQFDVPAGYDTPFVALLPDRVVIVLVADGRYDGTVVSFDRAGNRLPDTQLDTVPTDMAGLVLGGLDGTLYVETFADTDNSQTTKAYALDGDMWREVDSYTVEQNNDGVYTVASEGLLIGGTVVIPAQAFIAAPAMMVRYPGAGPAAVFEVLRTDGFDTTYWLVSEDFEAVSLPPAPMPYAGGVIFEGNPSGEPAQQYVAVLRAGSPSEFFRPNGWRLVGADDATALFSKVVDGSLSIGAFTGDSAEPSQVDWSAGSVLGLPLGFSSVDKVLTGINPVLGEPTADSGWFVVEAVAPGDEDCLAGQELRVLHWGDLTVAFKKGITTDGLDGEQLWSWTVGDVRASGFDSLREPVPAPTGTPTGLRTDAGFGLGSSFDELTSFTLGEVAVDGSRGGSVTPTGGAETGLYQGFVIDADGTVTGFGATQSFC